MKNTNKKVLLEELNEEDLNIYYYWKYLEPLQKAKEWNGPYIEEEKIPSYFQPLILLLKLFQ